MRHVTRGFLDDLHGAGAGAGGGKAQHVGERLSFSFGSIRFRFLFFFTFTFSEGFPGLASISLGNLGGSWASRKVSGDERGGGAGNLDCVGLLSVCHSPQRRRL